MTRKIKILALFACLLMGATTATAGFYLHYKNLTDHLKKELNFTGDEANAAKHAYAAYDLYEVFHVVLKPESAENIVLLLGTVNEYIEQVTKKRHPDSPREIMKDMHNNLAGVTAARWNEQHENRKDSLSIIITMAKKKILLVDREKNPFFSGPEPENSIVAFSAKWMRSHQEDIRARTTDLLNKSVSVRD